MSGAESGAVRQHVARVEALLETLGRVADPETHAAARELVRTLIGLHREGLARMLDMIAQHPAGADTVRACGQDDLVGALLLLHGLHPVPVETRVREALERVGPFLRAHGVEAELLSVSREAARVRMRGACGGGPSAAQGLCHAVEEAILDAAPDVTAVEWPVGDRPRRVPLPLVG